MASEDRRQREREELRRKIMSAARELFARLGYEAVSMRKIAEAIEYSPTAIYLHFKDKEELVHAICVEDFSAFARSMQALSAVPDPVQQVRELGRAYIRFGLKHPNHYRLMFMTPCVVSELDEEDRRRQGDPDEDGYAFLKHCVQRLRDADLLLREFRDVELAAQTFWAGVHGVVSLQIAKADNPWLTWRSIEKRSQAMLDALLRGILSDHAVKGAKS